MEARIVTGTTKLISLNLLYTETEWDTLKKTTTKNKQTNKNGNITNILFFYKMMNNLSPSYLSALMPQTVNTISHNLRNAKHLKFVASRINQYYNSCLPSVIREWNDFSNDVRKSDTFKGTNALFQNSSTVDKTYFIILIKGWQRARYAMVFNVVTKQILECLDAPSAYAPPTASLKETVILFVVFLFTSTLIFSYFLHGTIFIQNCNFILRDVIWNKCLIYSLSQTSRTRTSVWDDSVFWRKKAEV